MRNYSGSASVWRTSPDAGAQVQVDRGDERAAMAPAWRPASLSRDRAGLGVRPSRVPRRFPPGVHRHRSIEELDRTVEAWSIAVSTGVMGNRRDVAHPCM
jgi:hypothetical protein